jgi:hypothetical protein
VNSIGIRNRLSRVKLTGVAKCGVVGVGLAVTGVGWVNVTAPALADSGEHATATYIRAEDLLAQAQAAGIEASVSAINGEAARIRGGCPAVVVDAPHDRQLERLAEEVGAAVLVSGAVPDRGAMLAFAQRIARLRWNDTRIAKVVHMLATEERAIANLVIPDVCADLRAWVGSRYRRLSQDTVGFLKQTNAIGKGVGAKEESYSEVVSRLLARHEFPSERRTAKSIMRLEHTTGKTVLRAFKTAMEAIERALGLK